MFTKNNTNLTNIAIVVETKIF